MTDDAVDVTLGMTFDCADPAAQAEFWMLALGYRPAPPPAGWASRESGLADQGVPEEEWNDGASISDPAGRAPGISFLKVTEPKTAKNRLHLDLQVSGGRQTDQTVRYARISAKVTELVAAGATIHQEHRVADHLDHVVLLDPEGNEFCVV